jgi:hypothetical protein
MNFQHGFSPRKIFILSPARYTSACMINFDPFFLPFVYIGVLLAPSTSILIPPMVVHSPPPCFVLSSLRFGWGLDSTEFFRFLLPPLSDRKPVAYQVLVVIGFFLIFWLLCFAIRPLKSSGLWKWGNILWLGWDLGWRFYFSIFFVALLLLVKEGRYPEYFVGRCGFEIRNLGLGWGMGMGNLV